MCQRISAFCGDYPLCETGGLLQHGAGWAGVRPVCGGAGRHLQSGGSGTAAGGKAAGAHFLVLRPGFRPAGLPVQCGLVWEKAGSPSQPAESLWTGRAPDRMLLTAIRLPEKEKCTRQGAGSNSKGTGRQTPSGCKEEDYEK